MFGGFEATTGVRSEAKPTRDPIKNTPDAGVFGDFEATTGLEPVIGVLQTLALPTWLRRLKNKS